MKKVLITGITGQDGSYLAEYCLNLGHKVFGMIRRTSTLNDFNYKHLLGNPSFKVVYGDLLDGGSLDNLVREIQPDYFVNFAAQSFVGCSWEIPEETFMAGAVGVLKCLEAIRKNIPHCRFYNAGSSEQFGDVMYTPQDINHPFRPRSPYGAAKCAAHHLVKVYRESYKLYAIQGILFNHESPRRGEEFVTRKITKGIGRIVKAIQNKEPFEPVRLGNLDAKRDWSHAEDFVAGVWMMLNQDIHREDMKDFRLSKIYDNIKPSSSSWNDLVSNLREYVLSSNETHSVREFVAKALNYAKIPHYRIGHGLHERFYLLKDGIATNDPKNTLVEIDPKFFRPAEVDLLLGDSRATQKDLGWKPNKSFDDLVKSMVEVDLPNENGKSKEEELSPSACQSSCSCGCSSATG